MRKILPFFLLLLCEPVSAQNYDLNTYKYRYQKYRYAQFNFNFRGNNDYSYEKNASKDTFSSSKEISSKKDENRFGVNTSLPFNYHRNINTERLQHTQYVSINLDYSYHDPGSSNNDNRFYGMAQYNTTNRFYKGLKFTEFNFDTRVDYSNGKRYSSFTSNAVLMQHSESMDGNYTLSVGKGRGRQEFVTDVVTTMFLLRDLNKKAGIGNYTNEQIENIAKGITTIRNTRFIDFRFRLIDQLTLLDSTLKNNGVIPVNNMAYFTTMNDNWLYATQFARYSGSRWSVNFVSNGSTQLGKNKYRFVDTFDFTNVRQTYNNLFNGVELNYSWSHQASLFVQKSFSANLGGGLNYKTTVRNVDYPYNIPGQDFENKEKPDAMKYYLNLSYGYLFQPNTRTYIRFSAGLYSSLSNDLRGLRVSNPDKIKILEFNQTIQPRLEVFKFFSPRFYYNLTLTSYVYFQGSRSSDVRYDYIKESRYRIPVSLNMGFTYTFF